MGSLLLPLALALGCGPTPAQASQETVAAEHEHAGPSSKPHAATSDCASSCAMADTPESEHITLGEYQVLVEDWNQQPIGEPTIELETLLFYFQDSQQFIAEQGSAGMDRAHYEFLQEQLARDTVTMEMRLIDDAGEIRGTLLAENFPLKQKQHITFQGTGSLGHLETGGKVKRVGLGHLWSRW